MGYKPYTGSKQELPSNEDVIARIDKRRELETDPVERLYLIGCREYYRRQIDGGKLSSQITLETERVEHKSREADAASP